MGVGATAVLGYYVYQTFFNIPEELPHIPDGPYITVEDELWNVIHHVTLRSTFATNSWSYYTQNTFCVFPYRQNKILEKSSRNKTFVKKLISKCFKIQLFFDKNRLRIRSNLLNFTSIELNFDYILKGLWCKFYFRMGKVYWLM